MWNDWLVDENKTQIKTNVNTALTNLGYGEVSDVFWMLIYDMLNNNYAGRKLWPATVDEMNKKSTNIFIEILPALIEGWKKYNFKNDFFLAGNFGTKTTNAETQFTGNMPSGSTVYNNTMYDYENTRSNINNSEVNYQENVRSIANSLLWKTGIYDKLINSFYALVVQFTNGGTLW